VPAQQQQQQQEPELTTVGGLLADDCWLPVAWGSLLQSWKQDNSSQWLHSF